jgi:Rieske Fe-S protein
MEPGEAPGPGRRTLLRGALLAGATGLSGALAGCGGGSKDPGESAGAAGPLPGTPLGSTADVPVGGGTIISRALVVVTQPTVGQFRAFSSICTHQGCPVNQVTGGVIKCPCHFSQYSIVDGSVKSGPAPAPLKPVKITTTGGNITVA